jgi:alkanesulfonate monooxygenase SsuD/methylene tetrahydromethanopterin reductase-like flavin-dependent oxidoreductase (luciferase family)
MTERVVRTTNPLLASPNRLKLGVFGVNVSGGCAMTDMPESLKVDWQESVAIAQAAEAAGIEAIIPVARWLGMGGNVNFNHRNFETFTWAAGLAAVTSRIAVFATFHVPTVHPVRAAKEVATIDHISNGRFCLNMVAGWNENEIAMFGAPQLPHDERYEVADEWISLCKDLWTREGAQDWEGTYYPSPGAYSEPKPVQHPYPVLMSAGNSERGQHFAAKHCDLNFVVAPDIESAGQIAAKVKQLARDTYGRDIQVFGQGYIVCRETEEEAVAYRNLYVDERGDWEGVGNLLDVLIPNSQSALGDGWRGMASNLIAGYGAIPLVGTPEQVVAGMDAFAEAGLDGISISWVDYHGGLAQFDKVLRPMLVEAKLRES